MASLCVSYIRAAFSASVLSSVIVVAYAVPLMVSVADSVLGLDPPVGFPVSVNVLISARPS